MHPDLAKLVVLQRDDVEAKRLRDEMAALPKLLETCASRLKAAETLRAELIASLAKEETLRRRQESDVKDHQEKITRVRRQLDQATTTAQVAAFEHEIAFAQGEITKLEDAELESLERSETLAAQQTEAEDAVAAAALTLERERTRAAEVLAADKLALAGVGTGRAALRVEIASTESGEDALALYDRIAKARGTAVSEGLDQKCVACQMLIRPQRWNDLRDRDNDAMMSCESCGRLLYYDPARDAPQRKTVKSESIAASIVRSSI